MSFSASIEKLVETSSSPFVGAAPWWGRIPLNFVAEILNGYPWKSAQFNDQEGVPVIRIRDVTAGSTDTLYRGEIEEGFWIEDGDLLVGMDGDFNSRIWAGGRALLNQRVCRISPNEHFFLKAFMAYVLPGYLQLINDETHSITVKHLSSRTLGEIPLPLPPFVEQRRIVAKIDSLIAKSKRACDQLDHVPRLVEKYKQAILAAAFRGELTSSWRRVHRGGETAGQILYDIRRAHRAKYPPTAASEYIFALPSSWAWATAQEIVEPGCEIVYGIVQPGPKLASGVPYVRGTDIENGRIKINQLLFTSEQIAEKYARASLRGGDILLGIIRATKVAIVPDELTGANITQGTARFRPSRIIKTKFLARWLESAQAQNWLHSKYRGIDMPGLNLRDVRRLPVPLAPIDEQKEVAICIETAFAWIDRLASETTNARRLIDHLDRAVLAKAFRGELVPQNSSDEPASILLERIRAERVAGSSRADGNSMRASKRSRAK